MRSSQAQRLWLLWTLFTVFMASPAAAAASSDPTSSVLRRLLAGGPTPVELERFWRDRSEHGGPIIEPVAGRPDLWRVTFVFREPTEVENVVVITPMSLTDISTSVMARLASSDVWYRSFDLPEDARFAYRFGVNDSLIPFEREPNFFARLQTWRKDPLNPEVFDFGGGVEASVISLPAAPSNRWLTIDPVAPHGTLSSLPLAGFAASARAKLYLPPRWAAGGDYPLIVFMDGDSYTSMIPAPVILDNLIAAGRIPPSVAVFLDGDPASRAEQYDCNPGMAAQLADHLLPQMQAQYGAGRDRSRTFAAGFSLGGLAAACAALDRPDVFGGVLSQSGSFYRGSDGRPEGVARRVAQTEPAPTRWAIEIGLLETGPIPSRDPSMLTANRHLRDVLLAKGYEHRYREYYMGHEHVAWRSTLAPALIWLLTNEE